MQINPLFTFLILVLITNPVFSQKKSNPEIQNLISKFKNDDRGPYRDIRWFCEDGTINLPKEPCKDQKGVQRARYKSEVEQLAGSNHIFLGQILSTTSRTEFWDADNAHSRLKQYQLEKYLRAIDDGWILRKGQFYRGAFQVEDEEAWGINFFDLILKDDEKITSNYFLIREAVKDIPHAGDDNRTQTIRALSKQIADAYAPFMALRIKIHGQPDATDIAATKKFAEGHQLKLSAENKKRMQELITEMEIVYQPVQLKTLNKYIQLLPKNASVRQSLEKLVQQYDGEINSEDQMKIICDLLLEIRENAIAVQSGKARLALLDISIALENLLFKGIDAWTVTTNEAMMQKIFFLGKASAGCGYLELWEWEKMEGQLNTRGHEDRSLAELVQWHEAARRMVEWSAGMPRGVYRNVVDLYNGFEPLAYGFFDDKIRATILLPLGNAVSDLGNSVAAEAGFSNEILDLTQTSSFRGLNPGYALGELVVVSGSPDEVEVSKDKIYVFYNPASDLKPVAGIATVTEGNMVSHVQLLARNLGIPNAVLSEQNLQDLAKYAGKRVFYAVSNKGTVLMKLEENMTNPERQLFEVKKRSEEKIEVPVEKIELDNLAVLNLRSVSAKDSGKKCGPKAANLGQLKLMFPDQVVEGLVIPFGIFRDHMEQVIPGRNESYWAFLNNAFSEAAKLESEAEYEQFMLEQLEIFRNEIKKINLKGDFINELKKGFTEGLGKDMGDVPVFLRSDTNMEDLKDFTGAGLNLTLFNVVEAEKILQGIRDVWASPYTERSYKWRQKYLLNPENVYPSILIIPSVDVDYSGVLITKGITSGDPNDMTVAFSRGAGGAVDGQAAESYLLENEGGDLLLSPAREPGYRRLPVSGGTSNIYATFNDPILNKKNLNALRALTEEVNRVLPSTEGVESSGPFDIELGFKDDKMWLFQIRPFVENKNAKASAYLESITPKLPGEESIEEEVLTDAENIDGDKAPRFNWLLYSALAILVFGGIFYFFNNRNRGNLEK